jgi:hypothetical protein
LFDIYGQPRRGFSLSRSRHLLRRSLDCLEVSAGWIVHRPHVRDAKTRKPGVQKGVASLFCHSKHRPGFFQRPAAQVIPNRDNLAKRQSGKAVHRDGNRLGQSFPIDCGSDGSGLDLDGGGGWHVHEVCPSPPHFNSTVPL